MLAAQPCGPLKKGHRGPFLLRCTTKSRAPDSNERLFRQSLQEARAPLRYKPARIRPGTVEAIWREQSATYCCQLSMRRWGRMLLGTRDHKSGAIGKGKGQSPEGPRPALRLTTLTSLKRPTSCADA